MTYKIWVSTGKIKMHFCQRERLQKRGREKGQKRDKGERENRKVLLCAQAGVQSYPTDCSKANWKQTLGSSHSCFYKS